MIESRNIILTGATGIVGCHILYELILERLENRAEGRLIVLARSNMKMTGEERVSLHLSHDNIPEYLAAYELAEILSYVDVIECSFHHQNIVHALAKYSNLENCLLIHSAATTNLSSNAAAEKENLDINYKGTLQLYEATKHFISKFIYISTVYASGMRSGEISNEYGTLKNLIFRNPYEAAKYAIERRLEETCKEDNIALQILRPSVVVGRLLDKPSYFLPKFNVIYAFAAFFYALEQRGLSEDINIQVSRKTHLHLIPVDYVAKAVLRASRNDQITELNIVPRKGSGIEKIKELLEVVGYIQYQFIEDATVARGKMEKVYQSKVADSFGQYIKGENYEFDNTKLLELMEGVEMPEVNSHFKALIEYARDCAFKGVE